MGSINNDNVFYLSGDILDNNLAKWLFQRTVTVDHKEPLIIVINSPGGEVIQALEAVRLIERSKRKVITLVTGTAESAAFLIAISGHKRVMLSSCTAMCHPFSLSAEGTYHELEDLKVHNNQLHDEMIRVIKHRSKLSTKQISNKVLTRGNNYFTALQMADLNLVDVVLNEEDSIAEAMRS